MQLLILVMCIIFPLKRALSCLMNLTFFRFDFIGFSMTKYSNVPNSCITGGSKHYAIISAHPHSFKTSQWHFNDIKGVGRDIMVWVIWTWQTKQGVYHIVALPYRLKHILQQEKNYENSNISSHINVIFKKSSKRNQNPSRYYNSVTNLKFQHKLKYHLSKILV